MGEVKQKNSFISVFSFYSLCLFSLSLTAKFIITTKHGKICFHFDNDGSEDLWIIELQPWSVGSLEPSLLLKAWLVVVSEQVAQAFIQLGLENLQEWKPDYSGQPALLLGCPCGNKGVSLYPVRTVLVSVWPLSFVLPPLRRTWLCLLKNFPVKYWELL